MAGLNEFRDDKKRGLEEFRRKANEEIAKCMSEPWTLVELSPKIAPSVDPTPPPIYVDPDTIVPKPPRPIIIEETIKIPEPAPQPQPVEPIVEVDPEPIVMDDPSPEPITPKPLPGMEIEDDNSFGFTLYGTQFKVRKPDLSAYRFFGHNPESYAKSWRSLNNNSTNNLIIDCLSQRDERALCDWAYMQMIKELTKQLIPENRDKATLLAGFLMCQSGYRIRFATDSGRRLQLLYSPSGAVYDVPSIFIDGYSYYLSEEPVGGGGSYEVCRFDCPGEKQLSFEITRRMKLDYDAAETRHVQVHNNKDIAADVTVNRNLIEFYDGYPAASIGKTPYSRWAIYANTPVSAEMERDLYPVLQEAVKGLSQFDAANLLIHFAESFPYGYDSEIWGGDRAFFADESWFYPYSDCEDHAIHFTRLVRDILGLESVLIYYPGHLASAVAFTDPSVQGDYVMHKGKRFIVCDPTIFYANIGTTMPGFDNSSAVLIDLR